MEKIKIECKSCDGTGLYKGCTERDECAVVCSSCNGTGAVIFEYQSFKGRKIRKNITRVFQNSFGFVHSSKNYKTEYADIEFEKYGCSYDEWLEGATPLPVEDLYCPYIANNNGMGNEPLEKCKSSISLGSSITSCIHTKNKKLCWQEYNKIKKEV